MQMTIEDIQEFKNNAVKILERNTQYATANAVKQAFSALVVLDQIRWERDIAIEQLSELGLSLGQIIDGKYLAKEEYDKLLEYKYMYKDLCKQNIDFKEKFIKKVEEYLHKNNPVEYLVSNGYYVFVMTLEETQKTRKIQLGKIYCKII